MKLEIGTNDYFDVRHIRRNAAVAGDFSVLYLSDLHFNRHSIPMVRKILERVESLDPDILLLGGDYVDFKTQLPYLDQLLNGLRRRHNVFAIAGNHDYTFNIYSIKERMEANNINWIEHSSVSLQVNGTAVQLDGTRPVTRKQQAEFSILCLHQPVDISRFAAQYDLAFAGHLHGCQFIFWQNKKGLYPGRYVYRWNRAALQQGNCDYYISRGMGDTLPLRFNCTKEMIFVQVTAAGQPLNDPA